MLLRLEYLSGVDNVRSYPNDIIGELEQLLLAGGPASPDPKRKNFYDLESPERTFFIHISPINGRVVLVATWLRARKAVDLADQPEASLRCTA